jgi:cytochrome c-type biogenesis protein CcmH
MKPFRLFPAVALLAALAVLPVSAQTPTPNQVNEIAKELWCPLCNGVRLDNCELKACEQMREVIAEKLTAGESKEQIKAYFVQQYGDVVLGAPANEGFDRVVWILPVLAGIVALGWLVFFTRAGLRRRSKAVQVPESGAAQPPAAQDEYMKRVDDELQRYQ